MRVITRGDLDGTMCVALLKQVESIDEWVQAHPKDMQDGLVDVREGDIICNLPYAKGCSMWFDHHASEERGARQPDEGEYTGSFDATAPSAARLVYDYYVGKHPELKRHEEFLEVVDRVDSAQVTLTDVAYPQGPVLLAFLLDPRTGLGRYHDYRISNRQMVDMMPDLLIELTVDEVLAHADVKERADRYWALHKETVEVFTEHSRREDNVIISDFRGMSSVPPGNRFLVYTLDDLREGNISMLVQDAKGGEKVSIAVGLNIFRRTSEVHVGALLAGYGGGGHKGAGTCQVPKGDADGVIAEILAKIKD